MEIRPYKLITSSELEQLGQSISGSVNDWKQDWLADDIALSLSVAVTHVNVKQSGIGDLSDSSKWLVGHIDGEDALIGLYRSDGLSGYLGCQFQARDEGANEETTPLAEKVINRKLTSLLETVLTAYYPTPPRIIRETNQDDFIAIVKKPGCGFIEVKIEFDNEYILLVFDYKVFHSSLNVGLSDNNDAELLSAISAFGDAEVVVDAYIGEASLDISSLSGLSPGDILKLDTAIDKPVELRIDGKHLCNGNLGHLGDAKAIKIMK